MNRTIAALCITAFSLAANGQNSQEDHTRTDLLTDIKTDTAGSIGSLAASINGNFSTEQQKARAIFYWITQHISYAPELIYTFSTSNNNRALLAKEAFSTRNAICTGYAALFDTLCRLSNLNSCVVLGSTRQSFLPSIMGHAWNAVKIDGEWQLADATWGSGYLKNNTFVKKTDNSYFLPPPTRLIKTHLPLDPIWQLQKYPVTLHEFHNQQGAGATQEWNYQDSISAYLASGELAKVRANARRLTAFGYNSEFTFNHLNNLKAQEYEIYNAMLGRALKEQNNAVELFNSYADFKNHQYTPVRPDAEIKKLMPAMLSRLDSAEQLYTLVVRQITEQSHIDNINRNLGMIGDMKKNIAVEQKFVNKYLATTKNKRRDLFYTRVYISQGGTR